MNLQFINSHPLQMKDIQELKEAVQRELIKGIDAALKQLFDNIPNDSDTYNSIVLLAAQNMEISKALVEGIITRQDASLQFNKLRKSILQFTNQLTDDDLQQSISTQKNKVKVGYGNVLYHIPTKMKVGTETKCIVRIAKYKHILLKDLQNNGEAEIKDVRISGVMGAQIIDPNKINPFEIRTINEVVQFIDDAEYTEWQFYVQPVVLGEFCLILKISIIELKDGIERKKEVVLEELIEILSEDVTQKLIGYKEKKAYAFQYLLLPYEGIKPEITEPLPTPGNSVFEPIKTLGIILFLIATVVNIFLFVNIPEPIPEPEPLSILLPPEENLPPATGPSTGSTSPTPEKDIPEEKKDKNSPTVKVNNNAPTIDVPTQPIETGDSIDLDEIEPPSLKDEDEESIKSPDNFKFSGTINKKTWVAKKISKDSICNYPKNKKDNNFEWLYFEEAKVIDPSTVNMTANLLPHKFIQRLSKDTFAYIIEEFNIYNFPLEITKEGYVTKTSNITIDTSRYNFTLTPNNNSTQIKVYWDFGEGLKEIAESKIKVYYNSKYKTGEFNTRSQCIKILEQIKGGAPQKIETGGSIEWVNKPGMEFIFDIETKATCGSREILVKDTLSSLTFNKLININIPTSKVKKEQKIKITKTKDILEKGFKSENFPLKQKQISVQIFQGNQLLIDKNVKTNKLGEVSFLLSIEKLAENKLTHSSFIKGGVAKSKILNIVFDVKNLKKNNQFKMVITRKGKKCTREFKIENLCSSSNLFENNFILK